MISDETMIKDGIGPGALIALVLMMLAISLLGFRVAQVGPWEYLMSLFA